MTTRFFVVSLDNKIYQDNPELASQTIFSTMTASEVAKIADREVTLEDVLTAVNIPEAACFNPENCYVVAKEDDRQVVSERVDMVEDDFFDVIVNNELEVHIKCNDVGYSVDLYRHAEQEDMDDDYDFDDDFLSGCQAWFDDIRKDDEESEDE